MDELHAREGSHPAQIPLFELTLHCFLRQEFLELRCNMCMHHRIHPHKYVVTPCLTPTYISKLYDCKPCSGMKFFMVIQIATYVNKNIE